MNLYGKVFMLSLLTLSLVSRAEPPAVTLYLLGYDIPTEKRMSVVKKDVDAFERYQQQKIKATFFRQVTEEPPKSERNNYPIIDVRDLTLCDIDQLEACLTQIRQDPKPYRQSLQVLQPLLQDIDKLQVSNYQKLQSVFPNHLQLASTPWPSYQLLIRPLLTRNALNIYDNSQKASNSEQTAAQICADISFGKSLIQSQQSLVQSMIGKAILHSQLDLLAYSVQPLPKACQSALEPMPSATISICPLIKLEAQFMSNEMMGIANIPILYSRQATIKQVNKRAAPYCNSQWLNSVSNDEVIAAPQIQKYQPILFNRIGGKLLNIATPNYSVYQDRLQDSNAHLRLWQAALDPQCAINPEHYLTSISGKWHPARQLRLDAKQHLTIDTYNRSRYPQLSVGCQSSLKT